MVSHELLKKGDYDKEKCFEEVDALVKIVHCNNNLTTKASSIEAEMMV